MNNVQFSQEKQTTFLGLLMNIYPGITTSKIQSKISYRLFALRNLSKFCSFFRISIKGLLFLYHFLHNIWLRVICLNK